MVLYKKQGLVGAIFEGIGVSTGSFICGYLMDELGGSITFRIFGVTAICLSIVHFFVQRFLDNFSTRHGKTLRISQQNSQTIGALGLDDKNDQSSNSIESYRPHSNL